MRGFMLGTLFTFLKSNFVNLLLFAVVGLIGYYAIQISIMTSKIETLNSEKTIMAQSISNVESDKENIRQSLESEKLLREQLQDTIDNNSRRLDGFIEASKAIEKDEATNVITLTQTVMESKNENCINSDMPLSIIGMFNNKSN